MKQRVILVHGFNVSDKGAGTTGRLAELLRKDFNKFEVIEFAPGWRGLLGVRLNNKRLAQQLAQKIQPNDILIGHSDGCNLLDKALHELSSLYPAKVKLVYINPALDRDTALSSIVERCLVFHTESDRVVWLSRFLAFHPWGEMGMKGYKPAKKELFDFRYQNVPFEKLGFHNLGHSGVFKSPIALNSCCEFILDAFSAPPRAIPIKES